MWIKMKSHQTDEMQLSFTKVLVHKMKWLSSDEIAVHLLWWKVKINTIPTNTYVDKLIHQFWPNKQIVDSESLIFHDTKCDKIQNFSRLLPLLPQLVR